jgi:hypothetical protein
VNGPTGSPTGSLGEEAAKLLRALQDWAEDHGGSVDPSAAAAAAAASSTGHRVGEHVATGAEECRYCPLCRVISAARGTPPEVRQHLASAATSLMHAAAGVLATPVPDPQAAGPDPVEKISLDDEWEDD